MISIWNFPVRISENHFGNGFNWQYQHKHHHQFIICLVLTCGVQCGCGGESGRVWLFDRDFHIFFEKTCPTFVDDLDFCMLACDCRSVSSFLWANNESLLQLPTILFPVKPKNKTNAFYWTILLTKFFRWIRTIFLFLKNIKIFGFFTISLNLKKKWNTHDQYWHWTNMH